MSRREILDKLSHKGTFLRCLPMSKRGVEECQTAISNCPLALQFVDNSLKRLFAPQAILDDIRALDFAPEEFQTMYNLKEYMYDTNCIPKWLLTHEPYDDSLISVMKTTVSSRHFIRNYTTDELIHLIKYNILSLEKVSWDLQTQSMVDTALQISPRSMSHANPKFMTKEMVMVVDELMKRGSYDGKVGKKEVEYLMGINPHFMTSSLWARLCSVISFEQLPYIMINATLDEDIIKRVSKRFGFGAINKREELIEAILIQIMYRYKLPKDIVVFVSIFTLDEYIQFLDKLYYASLSWHRLSIEDRVLYVPSNLKRDRIIKYLLKHSNILQGFDANSFSDEEIVVLGPAFIQRELKWYDCIARRIPQDKLYDFDHKAMCDKYLQQYLRYLDDPLLEIQHNDKVIHSHTLTSGFMKIGSFNSRDKTIWTIKAKKSTLTVDLYKRYGTGSMENFYDNLTTLFPLFIRYVPNDHLTTAMKVRALKANRHLYDSLEIPDNEFRIIIPQVRSLLQYRRILDRAIRLELYDVIFNFATKPLSNIKHIPVKILLRPQFMTRIDEFPTSFEYLSQRIKKQLIMKDPFMIYHIKNLQHKNKINRRKSKWVIETKDNPDDPKCCVCWKTSFEKTNCCHYLCTNCRTRWERESYGCPMCRSKDY